ncbi:tetratricopeptide repeat protein [Geomesophilobacter sediminis]|uniref:Tetratricopeptide repeat protein n=1 Tax=Geomesophilobacter sediminis TaxID=2798584 RepID=A0A8J7M1S1_9BACT|nr:tetratricopeptide repeat protein [Geomesophilobacter sediminis]MBJ6726843.1 tetratricopeptide repeat protein [Geomesophilobacter sediminis]
MTAGINLSIAEALDLARLLQDHEAGVEAEKLYRRVLDAAPDHLDALHFCALLCHRQGRLDEAERLIRRILELDPNNADAHNNLGNVMQTVEKSEEAERRYRRAIELDPNHPSAFSNLGVVLAAAGRHEEAVASYRRAVEIDPNSAEVRCNLGNALRRTMVLDEAVAAYQDAIRVNPGHDDAWNGLALSFRLAKRHDLAARVFEDWLRFRPGDPSIQYLMDACCGERTPERAPDAYIRTVFDGFAEGFDSHLKTLSYRASELICDELASALPKPRRRLDVLDAGCGTGLCGPRLAPYARILTGVDLSPQMLTKAEERKVYDALVQAEISEFMGRHRGSYDVVLCCDTLCYFGELTQLFGLVHAALRPAGVFAFTVEASDEADGVKLTPTGRYVHGRAYVYDALATAGLSVRSYACESLRTEGGNPVAGHLVVAERAAA